LLYVWTDLDTGFTKSTRRSGPKTAINYGQFGHFAKCETHDVQEVIQREYLHGDVVSGSLI